MADRILIFGANGQLGQELARQNWPVASEVAILNRAEADLAVPGQVEYVIATWRPSLVVNAAAYTAVDHAEAEPDLAYAANAQAPGRIAAAAALLGAPLVQISTDYVFDGAKAGAYLETDAIAPLNVYGASKAEGEAMVRAANPRHVILRTSWVYSPFGQNFVRTMVRLGHERDELRVVADQIGAPTAAGDLAHAILRMAPALTSDGARYGTYHLTGGGETSWYGFADAIMADMQARTGRRPLLASIPSESYPTPAKRPLNSRLDCGKFASVFGFSLPPWQDSLASVLKDIHRKAA